MTNVLLNVLLRKKIEKQCISYRLSQTIVTSQNEE